jgi:hypothetical protein
LKRELKTIIYPKASKLFTTKPEIKKCRDDIFDILVKQGYLVEDHPRLASGSESIRTSYSVGVQYQKALEDEFEFNKAYSLEPLERKSETILSFPDQPSRKYIIQEKNLKKAITQELSNFLFELFTVYEYILNEDYRNALKIEDNLVRNFLTELYKHYYNKDTIVQSAVLDEFVSFLSTVPNLSFTKEELNGILTQAINLNSNNLKSQAEEIYEVISSFFEKIQAYIYKEDV